MHLHFFCSWDICHKTTTLRSFNLLSNCWQQKALYDLPLNILSLIKTLKFHSQVTAPWSAQDSSFYLHGSPTPTRSTVKQVDTSCSITDPRNSRSRRRTSTWPCHGMLTSHPVSENSTPVHLGRSGWTRCHCWKKLFFLCRRWRGIYASMFVLRVAPYGSAHWAISTKRSTLHYLI